MSSEEVVGNLPLRGMRSIIHPKDFGAGAGAVGVRGAASGAPGFVEAGIEGTIVTADGDHAFGRVEEVGELEVFTFIHFYGVTLAG